MLVSSIPHDLPPVALFSLLPQATGIRGPALPGLLFLRTGESRAPPRGPSLSPERIDLIRQVSRSSVRRSMVK